MVDVFDQLPVRLSAGVGALDGLAAELRRLGAVRPLLVTSPSVYAGPLGKRLTDLLGDTSEVFADCRPHVPTKVVAELADLVVNREADVLVAVGGGSVIDTAKAAAAAAHIGGTLPPRPPGSGPAVVDCALTAHAVPRLVFVPTSLTGGELTAGFTVHDEAARRKVNYRDLHVRPALVVQDPEALAGTPRHIVAESGMNSLAHSVEALQIPTNPRLSRPLHAEVIRLYARFLLRAVERPDDGEAAQQVLLGSVLSTYDYPNGKVGVVHAAAHAVTGFRGISHGRAFGVLLPHGMRFNAAVASDGLARVGEALGVAPDAESAAVGVARLRDSLSLPARLRDTGVLAADLPAIADRVLAHYGSANNPRPLTTVDDALELLHAAW